jgi:23S rRNA (adenine2503-C2)-methyltransferase
MIGCPVACSFCATGKLGYGGNLTAREIVDQVMHFQRELQRSDEKVTNIVYMGMGEPMIAIEEVRDSIDIFTDPEKLAMSNRRLTISTSGFIKQLEEFIEEDFKGRLAISLHAPNQKLREQLMPVAKSNDLDDLMATLDRYVDITNKRVSYEYILIEGINDEVKHAHQLADLLQGRLAHVNLIPYNPVEGENFKTPSEKRVNNFSKMLNNRGIHNSTRVTMGEDINAACGQLAASAKDEI